MPIPNKHNMVTYIAVFPKDAILAQHIIAGKLWADKGANTLDLPAALKLVEVTPPVRIGEYFEGKIFDKVRGQQMVFLCSSDDTNWPLEHF